VNISSNIRERFNSLQADHQIPHRHYIGFHALVGEGEQCDLRNMVSWRVPPGYHDYGRACPVEDPVWASRYDERREIMRVDQREGYSEKLKLVLIKPRVVGSKGRGKEGKPQGKYPEAYSRGGDFISK